MSTSLLMPPVKAAMPATRNRGRELALAAVALAENLLHAALEQRTAKESAQARQMTGLISDPAAKALSMAMTDRIIRSADAARAAKGWRAVLSRFGVPHGFGWFDCAMLRVGALTSRILPAVVMAAVRRRLRRESRHPRSRGL